MVYEAVYHSTDSEYCHALDRNTIVLRLRAKRGDLTRCVVCYGDRVYPKELVRVDAAEMKIAASDSLFDYFEAVIRTELTRICYYFILSDATTTVYYYGYAFHEKLDYDRNRYFQLSYVRSEDIAQVPAWAKEAVLYQIFPDSFATKREWISETGKIIEVECEPHSASETESREKPGKAAILSKSKLGGTLRGILDNIPYLHSLGVNCLYLTPIFTAGEYHKYDTIDYFSVDPCFGDMDTLKQMVSECHRHGIRVLLDGVFNHCGVNFFAFRDVLEKGERSRYRDWFFIRDFPVRRNPPNYECFAYVANMPKLNTGNAEVIEYFLNVGRYWIREADIDGWRLDVANEVNHDFWRAFRRAVKEIKPDAFLIGEVWFDAREWLMGDQFDSVMNYGFSNACIEFFAERVINVKQFDDRISYLLMRYKKNVQQVQMNLLDSHDVSRFLSRAGGDIRKLKLAVLFMMTHVGIPTVYYGDEKGMDGLTESDYRRPMRWQDTETSLDLLDFYRRLIAIRKEHMDLMTGDYYTLDADLVCNTLIYAREAHGKRLYILINNSEFPVQYTLEISGNRRKTEGMKAVPISPPCPCSGWRQDQKEAGCAESIPTRNICDISSESSENRAMLDLISGRRYRVNGSVVTVTLDGLSGIILKQEE